MGGSLEREQRAAAQAGAGRSVSPSVCRAPDQKGLAGAHAGNPKARPPGTSEGGRAAKREALGLPGVGR